MRLAFFGSGDFAVPTLEALVAAGHDIPLVVSQPDRPHGRGGKTTPTPLASRALELALPLARPEKPNTPEFAEVLRNADVQLAIIVAYGHLIRPILLPIPPRGFVNLHASLLPAYRGAAPVPWAILKGETVSGASVFQLNERFDEGAVLARVTEPITPDDTSGTYLARLAPLGAQLMADTVQAIASGRAVPQSQDPALASAAPKFSKEDGRIDWTRPFAEIERRVRALSPWPGAFTILPTAKGEMRVNVAKIVPAVVPLEKTSGESVATGTAGLSATAARVLAANDKNGLVVATGDLPTRISLLQPEGKRVMPDTQYLRGTKILT